jgi:FtsZ-binding cell division protein ZapB
MKRGFKDIEEYFLSVSQKKKPDKSKNLKAKLEELKEKVAKLEEEKEEYQRQIEMLKDEVKSLKESSALQKPTTGRIELIMEIALISTLSNVLSLEGQKVLLSRNFRKEISKILMEHPFMLEIFLNNIAKSIPKLKNSLPGETIKIKIESRFGNYSVAVSLIDRNTVKFEEVLPEE